MSFLKKLTRQNGRDAHRWFFATDIHGSEVCFRKFLAATRVYGGGGRLVAMSSVAGVRAEPGLPAYCASKAAIISIVRSLARELGSDGITVNAVAPGPVATELQSRVVEQRQVSQSVDVEESAAEQFERHRNEGRAIARLAAPVEVAQACSWLLSDAASYITGQVLVVDGGGIL